MRKYLRISYATFTFLQSLFCYILFFPSVLRYLPSSVPRFFSRVVALSTHRQVLLYHLAFLTKVTNVSGNWKQTYWETPRACHFYNSLSPPFSLICQFFTTLPPPHSPFTWLTSYPFYPFLLSLSPFLPACCLPFPPSPLHTFPLSRSTSDS